MASYLNQQSVTDYAQLCAEIKKLEARKNALRGELVEGFNDGCICPRRGPYVVKMTEQNRTTISWKEEFIRLAKDQLGKAWSKYMAKVEEEAGTVKTPMLLYDVNPDYDPAARS